MYWDFNPQLRLLFFFGGGGGGGGNLSLLIPGRRLQNTCGENGADCHKNLCFGVELGLGREREEIMVLKQAPSSAPFSPDVRGPELIWLTSYFPHTDP